MTAMQYFWRHPLAEEVREQGREEGREEGRVADRVEMTLRILEWRDIPVPDAVRERVESCTDLDQLAIWSQRAVRAAVADDLFTATEQSAGYGTPHVGDVTENALRDHFLCSGEGEPRQKRSKIRG